MDVQVMNEPQQAANIAPADISPQPPDLPAPDLPPMPMVVMPSAAIAFSLPTEAPAIVVSKPIFAAAPPIALVRRIVFGQGEGQQPTPEYPQEAKLAGQQGTVVVDFTVNESGQVTEAHTSPSRIPLADA